MSLKIAVITPLYAPSHGGVQESTRVFSRYLARQGAEVRVFTSQRISMDEPRKFQISRIRHSPSNETRDGVTISRMDCGGWIDAAGYLAVQAAYRLNRDWWLTLQKHYHSRLMRRDRMISRVRDLDPDVILCAPATAAVLEIALAARGAGRAKVLVHPCLHFSDGHTNELAEIISLLTKVDKIICNTPFEKNKLVTSGIPADRIHPISVGIDIERLTQIDPSKADKEVVDRLSNVTYVLYFGRRQDKKGMAELVEAFGLLKTAHPDAKLVIAGQDTDYFRRRILPKVAGNDRIYLIDDADDATKRWLYQHARVFSMVSRIDSFGIVYLESWLAGRPVIGADDGQMRDVIADGRDGYLVPAGDPAALAERIATLLKDGTLADRMGQEGRRKTLERFAGNAVEKELVRILEGLGLPLGG